jgi:hypothetical protein
MFERYIQETQTAAEAGEGVDLSIMCKRAIFAFTRHLKYSQIRRRNNMNIKSAKVPEALRTVVFGTGWRGRGLTCKCLE